MTVDFSTLQPGDILLTRSDSLVGKIIRFGERVKYHGWLAAIERVWLSIWHREPVEDPADPAWVNHAAVCIGGGKIIEALAGGLTLSDVSEYDPDECRVMKLCDLLPKIVAQERNDALDWAHAMLARRAKYSYLGILTEVIQICTWTKLNVCWDGQVFCSAYAAWFLEHAGYNAPWLSPFTVMPADLASILDSVEKAKKVTATEVS